jgi:alpha-glucoside transport system permease protein
VETLEVAELQAEMETASTDRSLRWYARRVVWIIIAVAVVIFLIAYAKARSTAITVAIAVGVSAAVWICANLLFNQVRRDWTRFNVIAYGVVGFLFGVALSGNELLAGTGGGGDSDGTISRFLTFVWFPLIAGVGAAAVGFALARFDDPRIRLVAGAGGLGALGLLTGLLLREPYRPDLTIGPIAGWTIGVAVLGALLSLLFKHPWWHGALVGAAIGWPIGAFGAVDLGSGSAAWAAIAATIGPALLGVRLSITPIPDAVRKNLIDQRSRAVIFLAPALLFIFITLVVPTIRTIYLSLFDDRSDQYVGLDNYKATFEDPISWNTSGWRDMFFSIPMIIAIVLLAVFVAVGIVQKRRTGRVVELGSPSMGPLVIGCLFLSFAVFTALRGTIINNLWWVAVVTGLSTGLGLAVAVLADRAKGERVAKSIIFMPMAISLVGASVIWRFMYVARDSSTEQTGVMNALWVGLGRLSTGSGLWTWLIGTVLTIAFVGLVILLARALVRRDWGRAVVPGVAALLLGWFLIRYWAIIGGGIGGQRTVDGEVIANPVNFVQEPPYNNFWLMVVLIWIQTGFSMVILSAAIKAVPTEFIEAARVDGATDSQIFWRVTLPQIGPTIGVVVTTLIVLVMKVYDIVKVMTNGNFGTQVLANDMFQQAFQFGNVGRGASLAVLIFVSVLPVMIYNIRRMQREV